MLERVKEIRERIRDDRVHYRDSVLRLNESHIVMNALQTLEALEKENAELRERLHRVVELPVKIGDTIYEVCKACDALCECKYYTCDYPEGAECHAPSLPYGYSSSACFSTDIVNEECKKRLYVEEWKFNLRFLNDKTGELEPQYFIDRGAAETRLKELKEMNND